MTSGPGRQRRPDDLQRQALRHRQLWSGVRQDKLSGSQFCKTFLVRNLRKFVINTRLPVPGKLFRPNLFEGKAGAYLSEAPFSCSTLV
jgi:hypothetical protein